jgi:tRNA (guanine9-N1)-methyltransferase
MAELEERPNKIRKLDIPSELSGPPQSVAAAPEAPNTALSNTKGDQPDVQGEAPSLDGQGKDAKQPKLSKSQLKKLKKKEQWEAGREYRKAKRREKHHEKQARKKEQREEWQAKIANGEAIVEFPNKKDELKRPRRPIQMPVSLILDCDFNDLMFQKELISLGAQLTRCYSENRKNPYRSHLALSSWGGTLKSRFETVLTNNHLSWKGVKFFEEDFVIAAQSLDEIMRSSSGGTLAGAFEGAAGDAMETIPDLGSSTTIPNEAFESPKETDIATQANVSTEMTQSTSVDAVMETLPSLHTTARPNPEPEQESPNANGADALPEILGSAPAKPTPSIVYLTADSPYTLERLSPNTCYIIGGIVDKNRHKGLCYKRACERGIPTAKLPIGEYMTMQSRSVLAVNHVVEIMLKWLVTGDWGEAFLSVIPKRKDAKLKVKGGEDQADNGESEDDDEGGTSLLVDADEGEDSDGIL